MKKFISGILALCLCLPIVSAVSEPIQVLAVSDAGENTVTIDGLIYELHESANGNNFAELIGIEDIHATSVTIPSAVNDGYRVTLPAELNWLYDYKELEEIHTENTEEDSFFSIDGVLFTAKGKTLLACPKGRKGAYTVPEGTETIWGNAFSRAEKLTSITLPESLKEVMEFAFVRCTALEEINGAVPTTNGRIIQYCSSLKSIEFKAVPDREVLSDFNLIDCYALETVTFPENMYIRGYCTVVNCPSLKSLTLNLSDELLQNDSLYIDSCESLETLNISGKGTNLNISDCANLNRVDVNLESASISVTDCPELTVLNCYNSIDNKFVLLENVDKLTVYLPTDEAYTKFGVPFVPLGAEAGAAGDVNGDYKADILDVITINRAVLGKERLTAEQKQAADVNGDGIIDGMDSMQIMRYIVGLIDSLDKE